MGKRNKRSPEEAGQLVGFWFWTVAAVAVLLVGGGVLHYRGLPGGEETPLPTVTIGDDTFEVELAASDEVRRPGLGHRAESTLPPGRGMLFIYPEPRPTRGLVFWMKNVYFDLDIAFISPDREIVTIHTMAAEPPHTADVDLKRYRADSANGNSIQFVLETRAGEFARRGIAEGDTIEFSPEMEEAIRTAKP